MIPITIGFYVSIMPMKWELERNLVLNLNSMIIGIAMATKIFNYMIL